MSVFNDIPEPAESDFIGHVTGEAFMTVHAGKRNMNAISFTGELNFTDFTIMVHCCGPGDSVTLKGKR